MLTITARKSSEGAKRYFLRSDCYEMDLQELVGRGGSKGAAMFGLFNEVDRKSFALDPRTDSR